MMMTVMIVTSDENDDQNDKRCVHLSKSNNQK